jgi:hypothetical protein
VFIGLNITAWPPDSAAVTPKTRIKGKCAASHDVKPALLRARCQCDEG